MYSSQNIANNIIHTLKDKGIQRGQMLSDLHFNINLLNNMSKSMPSVDKIALIADYLDVSVDFLLGRISHGLGLSRDELSLLELFRALPDSYRSELLSYSQFLCNKAEADAIKKEKASS